MTSTVRRTTNKRFNNLGVLIFIVIVFLIYPLMNVAQLPEFDEQQYTHKDVMHPNKRATLENTVREQVFNHQSQSEGTSIASILTDEEGVCVLALNNRRGNTLTLDNKSTLSANGCIIQSNSKSSIGLELDSSSVIKATTIFTSGGYNGPLSSFSSDPISNTTPLSDPLSERIQPLATESCDQKNIALKGRDNLLSPGTYCGGIVALGSTQITLEPGIYIMKDGPLILGGSASMSGENVAFVFEGGSSVFSFGRSTKISLTAPIDGSMSGILFFDDRDASSTKEFIIRSRDAQLLEGTVYLPKGRLVIDKAGYIGQKSMWTAIIANQIEIKNGSNLEINSNYAGSKIPVPDGVWPANGIANLTN